MSYAQVLLTFTLPTAWSVIKSNIARANSDAFSFTVELSNNKGGKVKSSFAAFFLSIILIES